MIFYILALLCIILGFVVGFVDKADILFDPLTWFVAAIAISMVHPLANFSVSRKG